MCFSFLRRKLGFSFSTNLPDVFVEKINILAELHLCVFLLTVCFLCVQHKFYYVHYGA